LGNSEHAALGKGVSEVHQEQNWHAEHDVAVPHMFELASTHCVKVRTGSKCRIDKNRGTSIPHGHILSLSNLLQSPVYSMRTRLSLIVHGHSYPRSGDSLALGGACLSAGVRNR
jgi:hypothetical protein